MRFYLGLPPIAAVCLALLAGCTGPGFKAADNSDYLDSQRYRFSAHSDPDNSLFHTGTAKTDETAGTGGGALGVNAFLWRGALETLSFMPLASADPFGGVIITDWYQPPASAGERFKATAYILGRQLRADGVRVSVFRQVMQGGVWTDAPVSGSTATDIENKMLARARELRSQASGSS